MTRTLQSSEQGTWGLAWAPHSTLPQSVLQNQLDLPVGLTGRGCPSGAGPVGLDKPPTNPAYR
jgi:hypothetical protein